MDFTYIRTTSRDEKIRAWAIEQAVESAGRDELPSVLIERAEKIEKFVLEGVKTDG